MPRQFKLTRQMNKVKYWAAQITCRQIRPNWFRCSCSRFSMDSQSGLPNMDAGQRNKSEANLPRWQYDTGRLRSQVAGL